MAGNKSRYQTRHLFEGSPVTPTNWPLVGFEVLFDDEDANGNIREATITIDELRFVGEDARKIHARARNGLSGGVGITEGAKYQISFFNDQGNQLVQDYIVDFTKGYRFGRPIKNNINEPSEVFIRISKAKGVSRFLDVINGATFGYIANNGGFSDSDYTEVRVTVKSFYDYLDILILQVAYVLIIAELFSIPEKIQQDIAAVSSYAASAATGFLGALLYALLIFTVRAIYILGVVAAFVTLSIQMSRLIIKPQTRYKGIYLRTLFERAFEFFGYQFDTEIEEFDTVVHIPSLPRQESNFLDELLQKIPKTSEGIPSVQDSGFILSNMMQHVRIAFWGRFVVEENQNGEVVKFYNNSDPLLYRNGSLNLLKGARIENFEYNTAELQKDRFTTFLTDPLDKYTTRRFKGTSYETITEQITTEDISMVNIRGLDRVDIPYALGNHKGPKDFIERQVATFINAAQSVLRLMGINISLGSDLLNNDSSLVISDYEYSVPKWVYMPGGTDLGIPANHRDYLSAKVLDQKYHQGKSFANNNGDNESAPNYENQHAIFPNTRVPFYVEDFDIMSENSYFVNNKVISKAERLEWFPANDAAEINGWQRERWTNNLTEVNIESEE